MNTIRIFLTTSGAVADIKKDFPLYRGSYQNKLLNVYVPTSILSASYSSQTSGTTTSEYVSGTSIKIGMSYTARNGAIKTSQSYFMRYLKTLMYQGTEYALYERMLPKEFTLYSGSGANAPVMTLNAVNVLLDPIIDAYISVGDDHLSDLTVDQTVWETTTTVSGYYSFKYSETDISWFLSGEAVSLDDYGITLSGTAVDGDIFIVDYTHAPVVLSVITSQTCAFDVLPSTYLDGDDAVEATELETVNAELSAISTKLAEKQDITDEALITSVKTVVGGINEVKTTTNSQSTQISTNSENIASNTARIATIEATFASAEEYIGQTSGETLPTDDTLTAFVEETAGREPKNADVVIFVQTIEGETDKNYKYIYSIDGWSGYEIPPLEEASNGSLGIVEGTYAVGNDYNTLVNIVGGQILNIYVKDNDGVYRDIQEYANALDTTVDNIISGDTSVGLAIRALQDGVGNNIVDTYLTQNAGATKSYVREYALPREFNDVKYVTGEGYSDTIPESTDPVYTAISSVVGDTILMEEVQTLEAEFQLSSKNSARTSIYVSADTDNTCQFRLTTLAQKSGEEAVTLSVELYNSITMTAGEIYKLSFNAPFDLLGDVVLSLSDGDTITSKLEIVSATSTSITYTVYSNEVYPSSFSLNTMTETVVVTAGLLGELQEVTGTGSIVNNVLTFALLDGTTLNDKTLVHFVLTYETQSTLADTTTIVMTNEGETVRLATPYNFESGNPTYANMTQTNITYNSAEGYVFDFIGYVDIASGGDITVVVNEDNLSRYYTSAQVDEILTDYPTNTNLSDTLEDYATIAYSDEQDTAYIGREQQVDFNATLSGSIITATLDETVSDFEFTSSTGYLFHIYLPVVTLSGELDDSYTIVLKDKENRTIYINSIFEQELGKTSTVGDLCQLQNYDIGAGFSWEFYGHYREITDNGTLYRVVYTDTVVREINTKMTGAELASALDISSLKVGTVVLVTETSGSYLQGHSYLINGTTGSDNVLIETATDLSNFFDYVNLPTLTDNQKQAFRLAIGAGDSGFTGDYNELANIPTLNTTNTASQATSASENISGEINLHKISKTGEFSDLNNIPIASEAEQGILYLASTTDISNGTDTTKAVTPKQLSDAIRGLGSVFVLKGSVDTVADLPSTNNEIGYVYYVIDESVGYVWLNDGSTDRWEQLGLAIDLSGYIQYTDTVNNLTSTSTTNPLSAYQGNVLSGLISTETETRSTQYTTLSNLISAETEARESADSTLQTNIDNEANARSSADTTLQSNIDTVDSSAVHIAGTETITGAKNFTGTFQINGGTITYDASTDTFSI